MSADKKHAILSPSSAHRWVYCSGAPLYEKLVGKKNYNSVYSVQGDAFHELMDTCLSMGLPSEAFLGTVHDSVIGENKEPYSVTVDEDMVHHAEQCVELVAGYINPEEKMPWLTSHYYTEVPVPITHLTGEVDENGEEVTGSIDFVGFKRYGEGFAMTMKLIDWKYGRSPIEIADNYQLLMYASGALRAFSKYADMIQEIELTIMQPKEGGEKTVTITIGELMDYELYIKERALATKYFSLNPVDQGKIPKRTPGVSQCKYCSGKTTCEEYKKSAFDEQIAGMPTETELESVTVQDYALMLSNEELKSISQGFDLYDSYKKAIMGEIEARVLKGEQGLGYKLVTSSGGHRKWDNEEEVAELMSLVGMDDNLIFQRKLKSPAQLEKAIKKYPPLLEELKSHIVKPEGKISVVPEAHKGLLAGPSIEGLSIEGEV